MRTWMMGWLVGTAMSASAMDWDSLVPKAERMSVDRFHQLMAEVYSPDGGMIDYLQVDGPVVRVYATKDHAEPPLVTLALGNGASEPEPWWEGGTEDLPLAGLRIALDPGHIGGGWSRMEERFFLVDRSDWPIQEAALNLEVMDRLIPALEELGAEVVVTKDSFDPVTPLRPEDFMEQAEREIGTYRRFEHLPERLRESSRLDAIRKHAERLFYRTAEIRARADLVNQTLKPHLTLALHFNATGYGDEKTLYEENGLAMFVHGNYLAREVVSDEQKYFLLNKLLEDRHHEEMLAAKSLVRGFVEQSGLEPAYRVQGGVMRPMEDENYIYARNLAANRQFDGPVVFLEPYFMNNRTVYARIQAGDYDGERDFDNVMRPSIFREYVASVVAGLLDLSRTLSRPD